MSDKDEGGLFQRMIAKAFGKESPAKEMAAEKEQAPRVLEHDKAAGEKEFARREGRRALEKAMVEHNKPVIDPRQGDKPRPAPKFNEHRAKAERESDKGELLGRDR